MHAALVACTIANCHGSKMELKDFMLRFVKKVKRQTAKQMMAVFQQFTNWFNGTPKNGNAN